MQSPNSTHTPLDSAASPPHLLTLPDAAQEAILRPLPNGDLRRLALACKNVRDLVYCLSVTKLTFTTANMGHLPKGATFCERYPAVTHLSISFEPNTSLLGGACEGDAGSPSASASCHPLIHQLEQQHLRNVEDLYIHLGSNERYVREASQLIKSCTSLKQLQLQLALSPAPDALLILQEPAPGQGLQHHHGLLDNGATLDALLGSRACQSNLVQLHSERIKQHAWCSVGAERSLAVVDAVRTAAPGLHSLRGLTLVCKQALGLPALMGLTRLRVGVVNYDRLLTDFETVHIDLPALQELYFAVISARYVGGQPQLLLHASLQQLTKLSVEGVALPSPGAHGGGSWGITALKDLSFRDCQLNSYTPAELSSHVCTLPHLTRLFIEDVWLQTAGRGVTWEMDLENALLLLDATVCCSDGVHGEMPQCVPTSLTSFYMAEGFSVTQDSETRLLRDDSDDQVWRMVHTVGRRAPLPPNLASCTNLRVLKLATKSCYEQWPLAVAQLTGLQHLELRNTYDECIPNTLDVSHLDALTQLTCLKLLLAAHLVGHDWPRLQQAAQLRELALRRCCGWPSSPLPPSLTKLLVSTDGSAPMPQHLSTCTSLVSLTVKMCKARAHEFDIGDVSSLLPCLEELSVVVSSGIKLSGSCLEAVSRLPHLQRLTLTGAAPRSVRCLGALGSLSSLRLGTQLFPSVSEEVQALKQEGLFPGCTAVQALQKARRLQRLQDAYVIE